jgi:regulator of protease activity HflC (stomatin/prohibitin superfamily)
LLETSCARFVQTLGPRYRQFRQRIRAWWQESFPNIRTYFIVLFIVVTFLTVFFWPYLWNRVFLSLKPGEAGVMWERFTGGTDLTHVYREGFQFVMPWNKMYVYNVRLQQTPHNIIALCKNGLPVEIEVSIRSRPQIENLPLLHKIVGENYIDVVVKPEIEAHVRAVVSQFKPEELYTSEGYILNLIVQGAMGEIAERYVSLDDLLIKRIVLPASVADAIQSKLVEEQRVFEYEFRVQQARKEAERKGVEAEGILSFQQTVESGGSFNDYLRYAGIQATLELAKSTNAKVVMAGGNANSLPIISFNLAEENRPGANEAGKQADSPRNPKPAVPGGHSKSSSPNAKSP